MEIKLKNSEMIHLEIGPLFIEYLDDYNGGLESLLEDFKNKNNFFCIVNHFAYAIIASNYDKPLKYRECLRLIEITDLEKIVDFISDNMPTIQEQMQIKYRDKHF